MPISFEERRSTRLLVAAAVFVFALVIRVRGIETHFWLLGDQMRDWGIALRPFHDLPLVGPPTHVGGYTIGPAYYWIMWAVRVIVGPWFDNLPHAGGVGQAVIESGADALLLIALWRRIESMWMALAAVIVIVTSAFDVALSAIDWTPPIASALGKIAVALVLLDWHRAGPSRVGVLRVGLLRVGVIVALAWSALQVYTGVVFVTAGIFAALLSDPLVRREWRTARRTAAVVAAVVLALQVPYLLHRMLHQTSGPAMSSVIGGVWRVLSGTAPPEVAKSLTGYAGAFNYIEVEPWHTPLPLLGLAACCAIVAVRYRRDPTIAALVLVPQALAIAGYALFLGTLDHYYYIPVMPVAVLTTCLAVAMPARTRPGQWLGIAVCVAAVAIVPARLAFASTMHRLPEYRVLIEGSRRIVSRHPSVRAIQTEFSLPPSSDSAFIYTILGGRIEPDAPWSAVIRANGDVVFHDVASGR